MCITLLDTCLYVVKRNRSSFKLTFSSQGGGVTYCTNHLRSKRSVNCHEDDL